MRCLQAIGWDESWSQQFDLIAQPGHLPGRIISEHRGGYQVRLESAELAAVPAGKLRHEALGRGDLPAVGDWVVLSVAPGEDLAVIHAVLPRQSVFRRKLAGTSWDEQLVATNVSTLFLVSALNQDFNLRRIERYVVLANESGAQPVLVLNKADLCADPIAAVRAVEASAPGVPIHLVSCETGQGLDALAGYLGDRATVALLGSSGVGKSTLVNRLIGQEIHRTQAARADDDRGRHTTTHRQLIGLALGGVLIDTPGMRELGLWASEEGFHQAFGDVDALAEACRFRNCQHGTEPGCAIRDAIDAGQLAADRFSSYRKLEREIAHQEQKNDPERRRVFKQQVKRLHKSLRSHYKDKEG